MSDDMNKAEQVLMWGLFASGGQRLLKEIVPRPANNAHNALGRRGFIAIAKHGQTRQLELTDKGWRWIAESEPFPIGATETRVTAERRLLQALTRSVKRNAERQGIKLPDLFRIEPSPPHSPDLRDEIRAACRDLGGDPQRDGIRLSALRDRLKNVAAADLDEALLKMREAGDANLMNLDNPRDIAAEKGAALRSGSQEFHVVWITA